MANINSAGKVQDELNRMNPAAHDAKLGDVSAELLAAVNALSTQVAAMTTKFNAVLTKLDADAGVTDTNYNATQAAAAYSAVSLADLESRN